MALISVTVALVMRAAAVSPLKYLAVTVAALFSSSSTAFNHVARDLFLIGT